MTETDQKLLDHFMNPRNVGMIEKPDGYGRAVNPVNTYFTDIYIRVKDGCIEDIKFKTFGCVVTIAAVSALTVSVKGKSMKELIESTNPFQHLLDLIQKELRVVPEKNWHCPPTAVQALIIALCDYYHRNSDEYKVKQVENILREVQCFFETELKKK